MAPLLRHPPRRRTPRTRTRAGGVHVAWVSGALADLLLAGQKTVESRLTRARGPAFGRVSQGDLVYFRETGGGYRAVARAVRVENVEGLTPAGVRAMRQLLGPAVAADGAYWKAKSRSRYATFIWLAEVREVTTGPKCELWPGFNRRAGWASAGPRGCGR